MVWFDQLKNPKLKRQSKAGATSSTPDDLVRKCKKCGALEEKEKLVKNLYVCSECGHHYRLTAIERVFTLFDEKGLEIQDERWFSSDPLSFEDKKPYAERLKENFEKYGRTDGTIWGQGRIHEVPLVFAVMDFFFMGGSMGAVTGEKIAGAFNLAEEKKLPIIVVSASGGARMQEGLVSLMQMAKVLAARERYSRVGRPYLSLMTDPTTGGVAASFATQGDLNLCEPQALIGFAGPRVIEQTINQELPEGFQRAEFLLQHGQIDRIIPRHQLREEISTLLKLLTPGPGE